ncbi:hypothetical protein LSUE1_G010207, partial [Lachnellula suecica]
MSQSSPARQTWTLHASYLTKASKVFATLLDPKKATHVTKRQRETGSFVKWRLEMVEFEDNPTDHRLRSFKLVEQTKTGFRLNDDVAQRKDKYHKVYDNLFKCIYSIKPALTKDEKSNAGVGYIADAVALLLAAEHLGALHGSGGLQITIEGHFLRLGDLLWRHMAAKPERWAFMAARIKSALLFREAMCHVVGKLDMKRDIDAKWFMSHPLRRKILELAEKKVKDIKVAKLEAERRLFEFFPARMMHTQVGNIIPARSVYNNDIYLWQARAVIQQYIASAFFSNLHHRGHDGGVQFYRTIGAGGQAYLDKDELEDFWKCFTMSGKGKVCFLDAINVYKEELKPIVADLLYDRSKTRRREGDEKLPWLT